MSNILEIQNLHVAVDQKPILNGLNLHLPLGKTHVIMGPNGSGKSTLANVLAGWPGYTITQGTLSYKGQNLLLLSPEERAHVGIFLGFQYPVEIPGVSTSHFLRMALNANRKARGEEALDAMDFLTYIKAQLELVGLDQTFLYRPVNEGFSGGEKKRNEILQMAVLAPTLAILDETDSGLDIDSLKTLAQGINQLRSPDRTLLIITHYQRLLDHIVPDRVHVLSKGIIARSGDSSLAGELEKQGYEGLLANINQVTAQ